MSEKDVTEEFRDFRKSAKRAGEWVSDNIQSQADPRVEKLLRMIFLDERTNWFLIGMACEAIGVTVLPALYQMTNTPYFGAAPDCLVGFAFATFLFWLQKRMKRDVKRTKN